MPDDKCRGTAGCGNATKETAESTEQLPAVSLKIIPAWKDLPVEVGPWLLDYLNVARCGL
ncbi:MAG TPA: hypothetical protein VLL05_04185 [Terriglobales bacterium]|nr:hypothetical protein [Terriglobales bacterium]